MKTQPLEWEKIFENHPSDKRLISNTLGTPTTQ